MRLSASNAGYSSSYRDRHRPGSISAETVTTLSIDIPASQHSQDTIGQSHIPLDPAILAGIKHNLGSLDRVAALPASTSATAGRVRSEDCAESEFAGKRFHIDSVGGAHDSGLFDQVVYAIKVCASNPES